MKTIRLLQTLPRIAAALLLAITAGANSWAADTAKVDIEKAPAFVAPKVLRQVAPVVRETDALGLVTARFFVRATIDERGRVLDARVTESEAPDLNRQIAAALGNWKFAPATRDGKAVSVEVTIPLDVNFAKVGALLAKR